MILFHSAVSVRTLHAAGDRATRDAAGDRALAGAACLGGSGLGYGGPEGGQAGR